MPLLSLSKDALELPALTTAHSHAFQRGMRGAAQRNAAAANTSREDLDKSRRRRRHGVVGAEPQDFWSWRGAMYRAALALDPTSIEAVSRVAFRELHLAGVRTVGEFHYVHHQADGTPYEDRTVMSDAVVRAARAEGLRVSLLRVAYHRAGPGREAEPGQKRFCDPDVDAVMRDVEILRAKYKDDPNVIVGVAPHSVRAVPPEWIRELSAYADRASLPFHMHVAEQPREIEECVAETGKRPVELLADLGALSSRFVAVHTTHLLPHEASLLGQVKAFACICATTEADLGDGLPDLVSLRASSVRLCTGIDSHVITDPIADMRALETLARLRTGTRVTFAPAPGGTPAEQLWREGSIEGAIACGFADAGSATIKIARNHPSLALVEEDLLLDAVIFGGFRA